MIRKSLLRKTNIESAYFGEEDMPHYGLNHYERCSHNCRYCYARLMKRISRRKWSKPEPVENSLDLLRKEIPKTERGTVMVSSMTDPYQPLDRQYRLTRCVLERLLESGFFVIVQTKSPEVLADIDLFQEYRDQVRVGMTIVTIDDRVRRKWEPGAPAIQGRIEAIERLSVHGISTQVSIEPLLPGTPYADILELVRTVYLNTDRWVIGILNYASDPVYYSQIKERLEALFDTCGILDRVYFKQKHAAFPAPAGRKEL